VVELLSIRIVSEVVIDNSRGSSECQTYFTIHIGQKGLFTFGTNELPLKVLHQDQHTHTSLPCFAFT
jgi:hypothetical protein